MEYRENIIYESLLKKRAFAAMIDYGVLFIIAMVTVQLFGIENPDGSRSVHDWHAWIPVVFWFILIPGLEAELGYTLGKGLLDLKVVRERKKDSPFAVAFKRHIFDFFDFFFLGAIAIILIKSTDEHKRIGDFIAHSRVVLDKNDVPA